LLLPSFEAHDKFSPAMEFAVPMENRLMFSADDSCE
jgi:hypothetical protein